MLKPAFILQNPRAPHSFGDLSTVLSRKAWIKLSEPGSADQIGIKII